MRKRTLILLLSILVLATACIRENLPENYSVPEGSPVTLTIGFGATTPVEVEVGTKAEATAADESRVHDLYVLVFNNGAGGVKTYGRYFNYEHRWQNMSQLNSTNNESEGWYVQNKTMPGAATTVNKTVGAVKIATVAYTDCTVVLLANVVNSLVSLDGKDPLTALNSVANLSDLRDLPVRLEQNVIERNDLFLMTGEMVRDLTDMTWKAVNDSSNPPADGFGDKNRITLSPLDAKVKFRIRGNSKYIKELISHKWAVYNIPSSCYLFPTNEKTGRSTYVFPTGPAGVSHFYFDTDPLYFDTEETETIETEEVKWYTFSFYMLESCLADYAKEIAPPYDDADAGIAPYYLRERKVGSAWKYAPEKAPYVSFNVSMTLTDKGVEELDDNGPGSSMWDYPGNDKPIGVTGDMTYTVHLGDFTNVGPNDYNTKRGCFYTYNIVINNARSLFAEVKNNQLDSAEDVEPQPGQEGSLLLFSGGTVNCDAHYEYRMMAFEYDASLAKKLHDDEDYHIYSWFVKTPFNPSGTKPDWDDSPGVHRFVADPTTQDYQWVKFAVNKLEDDNKAPAEDNNKYSEKRLDYPGEDEYDASWYPDKPGAVPKLLDINQLINYIYYQLRLKYNNDSANLFDSAGLIRVTAFVDEYYYERDPFTGAVDPNLWRQFVNADPRELYILSDVQSSRDEESHLVNASHSIIQRSIQTIYNVNAPDLTSAWGLEHMDEIRETTADDGTTVWSGWEWGVASNTLINDYVKSEDNGRINSAALWGLYPAPDAAHDQWSDFLNYEVRNSIPELRDNYRKMAYSCLTRNRDNNGDGYIDTDEVRWYMASISQLKALWIGNESLSGSARVYQPNPNGDWRAHILSSTCPKYASTPKVLNAEEGSATFDYSVSNPSWTDSNVSERLRESVRCVRNVGTYSVGGADIDISDAPYGLVPDNYYTFRENVDPEHPNEPDYSTYTILFSRLDSRSLREFTDTELPFHDEKSGNNRVYLELHTQSRASRSQTPNYADASSKFPGESKKLDMGQINEAITNEGYNKFCPAGYRLPNQKEMAMMSLTLPESYWNKDVIIRIPSRTFFSHGHYGDNSDRPNRHLLGFCYNPKQGNIFLPDKGQESSGIRCVRDNDRTGTILGNMFLTNNRLMPGETTTLNFNFTSSAASFTSGALFVCYNDEHGNQVETQIPLTRQPAGMQYNTTQGFTAPDPTTLTPSAGVPPVSMRLKLVLKNAKDDTEHVFETTFTIAAVDIHCEFELLPGSDETLGFPIRVQASALNGAKIQTLRLLYKTPDNPNWEPLHVLASAAGRVEFGETVYFGGVDNPPTMPATYYFKLEAVSSSNNSYTSLPKSMQFVVEKNFMPNPDGSYEDPFSNPLDPAKYHKWTDSWWQNTNNASAWLTKLKNNATVQAQYKGWEPMYVICNPWRKKIVDLNFAAGDFIEADMDLVNCVYINTNGSDNQKPGLDNILSFGRNGAGWDSGTLHVYYPAHVKRNNEYRDELRFYAVSSDFSPDYANTTIGRVHEYGGERPMLLRFDRNGITYNSMALKWKSDKAVDQETDEARYHSVVNTLTAGNSLYIGAEEGVHLSRAIYKYVRVIRVNLSNVWNDAPDSGFEDDPQNGGNL